MVYGQRQGRSLTCDILLTLHEGLLASAFFPYGPVGSMSMPVDVVPVLHRWEECLYLMFTISSVVPTKLAKSVMCVNVCLFSCLSGDCINVWLT